MTRHILELIVPPGCAHDRVSLARVVCPEGSSPEETYRDLLESMGPVPPSQLPLYFRSYPADEGVAESA